MYFFLIERGLQTYILISYKVSRQHHSGQIAKRNDGNGSTVSTKLLKCQLRQKSQCLNRQQKINDVGNSFNKPLNSCTYNLRIANKQKESTYYNESLSTMSSDNAPTLKHSFFIDPATLFLPLLLDNERPKTSYLIANISSSFWRPWNFLNSFTRISSIQEILEAWTKKTVAHSMFKRKNVFVVAKRWNTFCTWEAPPLLLTKKWKVVSTIISLTPYKTEFTLASYEFQNK